MNATFWRDTRLLGYVYAALFCLAVVRTIYQDHIYFVNYGKQQKVAAFQAASAATSQQALLNAENVKLQIACASSAAVVTSLQGQNREQQNLISNCQNQALKLLAPPPFAMNIWEVDDVGSNQDRKYRVLLVTNKSEATTTIVITCNLSFQLSGRPLSQAMVGGLQQIALNRWQFNMTSVWIPNDPIMLTLSYTSATNDALHCGFNPQGMS